MYFPQHKSFALNLQESRNAATSMKKGKITLASLFGEATGIEPSRYMNRGMKFNSYANIY